MYDLVIIGSGAAGLSAALYAGRYKLNTLVVEGEFGGETMTAGEIANYPGVLPLDGYELISIMKKQAQAAGAVFQPGWARLVEKTANGFVVQGIYGEDSFRHEGKSVLLAAGAKRRKLGLKDEDRLLNKGVHYCWTCDGPLYGNKVVAMVGGGDSSVKGVNFLGAYAAKIYLIVRGGEVHAEPVNLEAMKRLGDKVEVVLNAQVRELKGEKKLESVALSNGAGIPVDGLFVEIGFDPDPTFADQLGLDRDDHGYLKVDAKMRTNKEGVFAAGDATNHFGEFKQDVTAAATGAVAASSAYEYLMKLSVINH